MAIIEEEQSSNVQRTLPLESREETLTRLFKLDLEIDQLESKSEGYKALKGEIDAKLKQKKQERKGFLASIANTDIVVNLDGGEKPQEEEPEDDYPTDEELAEFEGEDYDNESEEEEAENAPIGYLEGEVVSNPEDSGEAEIIEEESDSDIIDPDFGADEEQEEVA